MFNLLFYTPDHRGIESEFVIKVVEDKALVITRRRCNCVNTRPVKSILGENLFRRIEYRLSRTLCIMHPAPSTLSGHFFSPYSFVFKFNQLVYKLTG